MKLGNGVKIGLFTVMVLVVVGIILAVWGFMASQKKVITNGSINISTNSITPTNTPSQTILPKETWQIQGSGHSYAAATKVVDNGSTLPYAFHYGTEAGTELSGTTRFYFNPTPGPDGWTGGVRVATNNSTETSLAALSHFTASPNGVKAACDQMNIQLCSNAYAYYMTGSQAVPLKQSQKIRLFFEAKDLSQSNDPTTQIFYLDSQDGYTGEDFNTNTSSSICGGAQSLDYAPGGECALSVAVAADTTTGLKQARQFKIGYNTLDSWVWDELVGTFMVITGEDTCGKTRDGLFYATWTGSNWTVTKDGSCVAPLVPYAHGPVLVQTGKGQYKLYYEDIMSNVPNNQVNKPLHYITADATRTGDPKVVDFEDWDSYQNAGEVDFLWPDGTQLSAAEESGLGDHFIYTPNGLDSQVMYLNLGGFDNTSAPAPSTGIGIAIPVR